MRAADRADLAATMLQIDIAVAAAVAAGADGFDIEERVERALAAAFSKGNEE